MTRRALMALLTTLPLLQAFDLVKVTVRCDGRTRVWWEPRAMAEKRFAAARATFRSARNASGSTRAA